MSVLSVVTFGPVVPDLIDAIARPLWEAFDLTAEFRGEQPIPKSAWDPARQQYSSEVLLRSLLEMARRDATGLLLGLTAVDLCIPMLSFVFGQAQLRGMAAVVSTARLDPEFYGLPSHPELVRRRLIIEALHEIGHTIGLVHCGVRTCPMTLATAVEAIDAKTADLCDGCTALARDLRKGAGGLAARSLGARKNHL